MSAPLSQRLDVAFPFARSIKVEQDVDQEGRFVARLVLPVRAGESEVDLIRVPEQEEHPDEEYLHKLRWYDDSELVMMTGGEGGRWEFYISWDGVASDDEIDELVAKRVPFHPLIGDPHPEGELIV